MKTLVVAVAIGIAFAGQADAGCRWEWLCDQSGKCALRPVCDSTLDIVPPRPPSVAPIVPRAFSRFRYRRSRQSARERATGSPVRLMGQLQLGHTVCY